MTSVKDIIAHMRRWLFTDDVDRDNESSKRARIVRKTPSNASQPRTQEDDVSSQSVVKYKRKHVWRSRRISEGPSAQSMPQLIQYALLPKTLDVDVINCMLSLLPQVINALGVDPEVWSDQITFSHDLSTDRDKFIKEELKVNFA